MSDVMKPLATDRFLFEDSVEVEGSLETVYDLLWDIAGWPNLLPHVDSIQVISESEDEHQFLMVTTGAAGTHITESIRHGKPHKSISYRQVTPPPLLSAHTGRWILTPTDGGLRVTSEHTIKVAPSHIEKALGRSYSVQEAALIARHIIGNHSAATLGIVKTRAEESVAAA